MRRMVLLGWGIALFAGVALAGNAQSTRSAWRDLTKQFPDVQFYWSGATITRVYGTPFGFGTTPAETADGFRQAYAGLWGVDPADLQPGNPFNDLLAQPVMFEQRTGAYKFTLVYFAQFAGGLPVFRAELDLLVRNEDGYPLVWAGATLKDLGEWTPVVPDWLMDQPDFGHAAVQDVFADAVNFTPSQVVVWAGTPDEAAEADVCVQFVADNGRAATPEYAKRLFLVSVTTGEIRYAEDLVLNTDITGSVQGKATQGWGADICDEETPMAMGYARVAAGDKVTYADANGQFTLPWDGVDPVTLTSEVRGQWFKVQNQAGSNSKLTLTVTPPGPADFMHNDANDKEYYRAEVNGFVQSNVVRDYTLVYNPTYPTVFEQKEFTVNVNINSSCNAYYDGSSTNFFIESGGCTNTANSTVVHHEYGHHLVQCGGSGQGAYGEGMADVMGVLITDQSVLAYGFYSDCNSGLRDANNNVNYPCNNEIHYCGMVISGAVWETRRELLATNPDTYREILSNLTINSILLHRGSDITPQITVDFLTLDDDNGDLTDGTPHYYEIAAGFGRHKLDAPKLAPLIFSFPEGLPRRLDPEGGTQFRVDIRDLGETLEIGTPALHYSTGGDYVAVAMEQVTDHSYNAVFPPIECGAMVHYYVSARTTRGHDVNNPADAPESFNQAFSLKGTKSVFSDNFETDQGWTVQNDPNLWSGAWERAVPDPRNVNRGCPETDFDGSGQCYVTDNRYGNFDVDYGWTRLISPAVNLAGTDAIASYARWFYSSDGDFPRSDVFVISVSNDDGATWVPAETLKSGKKESKGGWFTSGFRVGAFVTPSDKVRVMFDASDRGLASIIEAAIDAFDIAEIECGSTFKTGDLNCDGFVDFNDIDPFVTALVSQDDYQQQYPDCDFTLADVNGDGSVDFNDIDPFVELLTK